MAYGHPFEIDGSRHALIHAGGVLTTRLNDGSSFSAVDQNDLLEASGYVKRLLASTFLLDLLRNSRC